MKIAILSFTSGQIDRGVETVVRELAKRWQRQHQVKVYSAVSLGIKDLNKFNLQALRETNKFGAEIIMPVNGGWQSLLTRIYCWLKNKKMVISGQAGLGWCDGWNLLMRPDVFVALSERNRRWAKKFYGKGVRVEVISNGVDLKRFKPEGKKINLRLKRPIILCVASKDKYKRAEATKKAVERLGRGSFLWVGGERKFKHEQMPAVYRSADVFILLSDSTEAFGIAYLEALASGLPVVATDDELRREILGPYGIYVKNPESAAEAINKVTNLVYPKKWLEQFSWDKIAADYISIFSRLRLE